MRKAAAKLCRSAVIVVGLCLAQQALAVAAKESDLPAGAPADKAFRRAKRAVDGKRWAEAVASLQKLEAKYPDNAEVENLLGFSERNQGHMDAAFAHYEKALTLKPDHRPAHEYVGEAYLMVDNLPKAEEHLATLEKLCGGKSCEEYEDLEKAIDAYKKKHAGAAPAAAPAPSQAPSEDKK
jgi:Flp pilus assembly protein TadD